MSGYVGKAGHLAVMAEFCIRGYNVAMPEIDIGDDVFVVNDTSGAYWRVQVKTSNATRQAASRAYQFRLKNSSITTPQTPELYFIFVMRWETGWRYAMIERTVLNNYVVANDLGTAAGDYRQVNMTLSDDGVLTGSGLMLTHHLDAWNTWAPIG